MSHQLDRNEEDSAIPGNGVSKLPIVGVGLALLGAGVQQSFGRSESPGYISVCAIALAIAGVITTAIGISKSPRNTIALLIGAVTALFAGLATHETWDSAILLFQVAAAVSLVAAIIVNLPQILQRIIVSALVVFHFCGIFSAITSPPPQPALSNWAWVTLFRPHLVFCYTNNAYQFYSPDPGPASLLWFCVEYKDGTKAWEKLPRKPESRLDPLAVEYFRRLSITESANQNMNLPNIPQAAIDRRYSVADRIPLHPDMRAQGAQYRQPQDNTRRVIGSYAAHVAHKHGGPDVVRSVRVYRVLHQMLTPQEFSEREDPFQPATYYPYYLGEHSPDGTLLDPGDPLLYWLVPILRVPGPPGGPKYETRNFLAVHAGSDPFEF